MQIYTDGAVKYGHLGWGFVAVHNKRIVYSACGILKGPDALIKQRNVAAELKAVMEAVQWALDQHLKAITIVHDYKGCSHWVSGAWAAKNKYTQAYAMYIQRCKKQMKITFKWIKGHSSNKWNDMADALAKSGAHAAYKQAYKHQNKKNQRLSFRRHQNDYKSK